MARQSTAKATTPESSSPDFLVGTDGWEWETKVAEAPTTLIFEEIGEVFIGQYAGPYTVTPDNGDDPFTYLTFKANDGVTYGISKTYKLGQAFEDIDEGSWCRITYMAEIPSKKGNPLKDFRVDVRK